MTTLGFEHYIEPLKLYLSKYRDAVKGEKPDKKYTARTKAEKDDSSYQSSNNMMSPFNEQRFIQYPGSGSARMPPDSSSASALCSAAPSIFMNAFSPAGK
jgi:hypothetical protein